MKMKIRWGEWHNGELRITEVPGYCHALQTSKGVAVQYLVGEDSGSVFFKSLDGAAEFMKEKFKIYWIKEKVRGLAQVSGA